MLMRIIAAVLVMVAVPSVVCADDNCQSLGRKIVDSNALSAMTRFGDLKSFRFREGYRAFTFKVAATCEPGRFVTLKLRCSTEPEGSSYALISDVLVLSCNDCNSKDIVTVAGKTDYSKTFQLLQAHGDLIAECQP